MSTNFNGNIATNFTKIVTCEMSYSYFMRLDGETEGRTDGHDEGNCRFSPYIWGKSAEKKAANRVITGSKLPASYRPGLG